MSQRILISLVFCIVPFLYFLLTFVTLGCFTGSRSSAGQDRVALLDSFPLLAGSNRIWVLKKKKSILLHIFSAVKAMHTHWNVLKKPNGKRDIEKKWHLVTPAQVTAIIFVSQKKPSSRAIGPGSELLDWKRSVKRGSKNDADIPERLILT